MDGCCEWYGDLPFEVDYFKLCQAVNSDLLLVNVCALEDVVMRFGVLVT
jgi:hypothetical protein